MFMTENLHPLIGGAFVERLRLSVFALDDRTQPPGTRRKWYGEINALEQKLQTPTLALNFRPRAKIERTERAGGTLKGEMWKYISGRSLLFFPCPSPLPVDATTLRGRVGPWDLPLALFLPVKEETTAFCYVKWSFTILTPIGFPCTGMTQKSARGTTQKNAY